MIAALSRRALLLAAAVLCVVAMLPAQQLPPSPELAPAADTSAFRAGNIISDAVFYDSGAMSATQITAFLRQQGADCSAIRGAPCLMDYAMATPSRAADAYCGRYSGSTRETAAQIIAKVSVACDINPRVLLVTLQKEMGFITSSGPTPKMYERAMGYGCPDNAGGLCDSTYNGLFNQLYMAARQFQRYTAGVAGGYRAGIVNTVYYDVEPECGSSRLLIENQATANLYNYTPYRPNAAALAAGYGQGDSCSAYGNRNFWLHFTDWFGSTQTPGRDIDAPVGTLDQVAAGAGTVTVRGWTYDPDVPLDSINVHVYIDGKMAASVPTGQPRPDVARVYPGVGGATGFNAMIAAAPGQRTVCVYSVNVGKGYTNPLRGCRTVTVATAPAKVPVGVLDPVAVSALTVQLGGWAFDPDVPTAPARVHVYVDGRWAAALDADVARADVGLAYPQATGPHGYEWTRTLPAGRHEICTYAMNAGAGSSNPRLGCRTVTLGGPPVGRYEEISTAPGQVRIQGWALDPDTVDPSDIAVYVDGSYELSATADVPRPDVGSARPGFGDDHGFDVTLPVPGGSRSVCVFALNTLSGTSHTLLGCRTVTVPATAFVPIGNLDEATLSGSTVTVRGWALDQDVPSDPIQVHVKVDGQTKATTANLLRYDIAVEYPGAGVYHGWSVKLTFTPGGPPHEICAYGINVAGGSANTKLGCTIVTVP